jgi:hypothetical protein
VKPPKEPATDPSNGEHFASWKSDASAQFERLHSISASIIPDGVWTRFYIKGMAPEEAARAPELHNYFTRNPGERLQRD